ncbi:MAG: methyltransferase domain-containing protein [Lacibacter sp.]
MVKEIETFFRKYFPKRLENKNLYQNLLKGKKGIEIGGPSQIFSSKGILPFYDFVESLDGVNFSNETVWEGAINEGKNYKYGNRIGYQYVMDSVNLSGIDSNTYDFLLSCHSLEHIANPLKALNEWKRILKPEGYLLVILPHKDKTFDHIRPVTELQHIIADFKNDVGEDDQTHFNEVINLHDLKLDEGLANREHLIERVSNNYSNRCLHQHVFNARLVAELLDYAGLKILDLSVMYHNILSLSQKDKYDKQSNNVYFLKSNLLYSNPDYPSDFTN